MKDASYPKFLSFFDSLVRSATSKGVPLEIAKDLAGDAVYRALRIFDPARGEFPALCYAILANLLKNYWRDKKKTDGFLEGEEPPDPDSFIDVLELAETLSDIHAALATIMKELSPEEYTFLKHLQDVLDESGSRAISEAARRSGLTPAKGWDLFRVIQRKAKATTTTIVRSSLSFSEDEVLPYLRQTVRHSMSLPDRDILTRFTPEQLEKIESLLP
jgi:hypothetical protein